MFKKHKEIVAIDGGAVLVVACLCCFFVKDEAGGLTHALEVLQTHGNRSYEALMRLKMGST